MLKTDKHILWFLPAAAVTIGIFLLSTVFTFPIQEEIEINYLDKFSHCFAYLVLIISLLIAFKKNALLNRKSMIYLIVGASAYGLFLEWCQYSFFPDRYFEWIDSLANVIGVFLGLIIFIPFHRA